MTFEEFEVQMGFLSVRNYTEDHVNHMLEAYPSLTSMYNAGASVSSEDLPDSIDLRDGGCINRVKDQVLITIC